MLYGFYDSKHIDWHGLNALATIGVRSDRSSAAYSLRLQPDRTGMEANLLTQLCKIRAFQSLLHTPPPLKILILKEWRCYANALIKLYKLWLFVIPIISKVRLVHGSS